LASPGAVSIVPEQEWAGREFAMLVLSRKVGEKVVVPECGLTLTVLSVQGQRVRLGIAAPAETVVHREEVWLRRQEEEPEGAARLGCPP
jgi:carbon storage regulator